MGSKKSTPAPVQPTPQVQTPDVDVAQVAAEKALAAQGNVRSAQASEEDMQRRPRMGDTADRRPPHRERDRAAVASTPAAGGMAASSVLTG